MVNTVRFQLKRGETKEKWVSTTS